MDNVSKRLTEMAEGAGLKFRHPGPELGKELILLIVNHLSGASTVSFLLDHASLGVM